MCNGCKYYDMCVVYEDHYGIGNCALNTLGEKEMDIKLKRLMNGNGLMLDRIENNSYNEIKEGKRE